MAKAKDIVEPTTGVPYSAVGKTKTDSRVDVLPLSAIKVLKDFNPRKHPATDEEMAALRTSIKQNGLLHGPVVRPIPGEDGKYSLVSGHRRYAVCKELGFTDIPVQIRFDLEDDDMARATAAAANSDELALPLAPFDLSDFMAELAQKGWSVTEIAARTGHHARAVRRKLELQKLDGSTRKRVERGQLSEYAALAIAEFDNEKVRTELVAQVNDEMSASQVKALGKSIAKTIAKDVKPGKGARQQSSSAAKAAAVYAWLKKSELQAALQQACFIYLNPEDEQDRSLFTIGVIAALLYARGDLKHPILPSFYDDEGNLVTKPSSALIQELEATGCGITSATEYKQLLALLKSESGKYEPPKSDNGDPAEAGTAVAAA